MVQIGSIETVTLRQFERHVRGMHTLGDHMHLSQDVLESSPFAKLFAHGTIAAVGTHAGGYQISHTRQPCEGGRLSTHGHTEPGELGQPSRYDGGTRVVTDTEALPNSCCYGDDVLECPTHLAADDVVVQIDPEDASSEHRLDSTGHFEIIGCDDRRSRPFLS